MSVPVTVAGVAPRTTIVPADRAELAAVVRALHADAQTFALSGGGSELELGNPPRALDALVRTTALDRVLDYAPEDQTITVEAGMTLAALDAVLAEHDQLLPIDVADRARSTVGGAIAINAFGARRHRYGSIKDLIVGIEIVRPDGTPARGGGKVVKNVAGFDLPKLMVGSLGSLGAIVAATFRVFPRARASASVVVRDLPPSTGGDALAEAIVREALEPVAIVTSPGERGRDALVTFDGDPGAVDAQTAQLLAIARALPAAAAIATADEIAAFAGRERAARGGDWRVRAGYAPARVAAERDDDGWLARSVAFPTLGVVLAAGDDPGTPLDELAGRIAGRRMRAPGGLIFHAMPARWRGTIDAWGPPPPAFALMRALKANFDPHGRCNPGRFVGGL